MWTEFNGHRTSGKYQHIIDDPCVTVVTTTLKSGIIVPRLVIMPSIYDLLGKPDRVDVLVSGSKIGICTGRNYSVQKGRGEDGSVKWINISSLLRKMNVTPESVFDCYVDGDMVVFDTNNARS